MEVLGLTAPCYLLGMGPRAVIQGAPQVLAVHLAHDVSVDEPKLSTRNRVQCAGLCSAWSRVTRVRYRTQRLERNRRHRQMAESVETGETYTGDFYCVKCKEKRDATGKVVETNGRRMAKGKCPVCGTNLNRILGKA